MQTSQVARPSAATFHAARSRFDPPLAHSTEISTIPSRQLNTGEAQLHIATVDSASAVVCARACSPLRVLAPRSRGRSVWAYTSTFGGGMVAGDRTALHLRMDQDARCFLSTQASTKIYRNPDLLPCSHRLDVELGPGSLLVLAPDPVQCFADSSYEQRQSFQLASTANLIMVDWLSAGRTARGERWCFRRYFSRNHIERANRALFLDALLLEPQREREQPAGAGRFNCFATVVLFGPQLKPHAQELLAWCAAQPIARRSDLLFSASPVHEGAVLRLAGTRLEDVAAAIRQRLGFVADLLGDDPWARKW